MRIRRNPVLKSCQLALCCTLLVFVTAIRAQAQGVTDELADGLIVEEAGGAVKVKLDNQWQSPKSGMVVSLPATVSTGADGSIKLRQETTTISIGANTAIELFEGPEPGLPLQRVVQNQGSAFYDIAPRGSNKLRVETPYLVAVIKGTQFNVTVAAETSTVALFEGRLQIEAPDVGDVVDLYEGQIAKRHKDDRGITVLSMEDSKPVSRSDVPPNSGRDLPGDDDNRNASNGSNTDSIDVDDRNVSTHDDAIVRGDGANDGSAADPGLAPDAGPELDQGMADTKIGVDSTIDLAPGELAVGLDADIDLGDSSVGVGVDAGVNLAGGDIDVGLEAGVDLGDAVVDVGLDAGVDLAGGDIDVGLEAGVDLGDAVVDVGLDAGVDLAGGDIDVGLDGGVDLGDTTVDAGLDTDVDLDSGAIDVGLDAGVDLGDTAVDAGLDTGVDLDNGNLDLGVDTGIDLGVAGVGLDIGVDAGISLGDLDDLGDIDLGLDLLDDEDTDSDTDTTDDDEGVVLPVDPGDLLDLLGL